MTERKNFRITRGKGFHITFTNGMTLSVQFGPGNYGDNYDMDFEYDIIKKNIESNEVEVAMWDKNGSWITKEYGADDDVIGWVDIEAFEKIIRWCMAHD